MPRQIHGEFIHVFRHRHFAHQLLQTQNFLRANDRFGFKRVIRGRALHDLDLVRACRIIHFDLEHESV